MGEKSSYRLAGIYAILITGLTISNLFSLSLSWNMFSFILGWCLALFTILLSYGFVEAMRNFPWFWNSILVSYTRVIVLSDLFGLAGCMVSLVIDPTNFTIIIELGVVASILIALFAYILKKRNDS
ncbi:MAG: hypothetical protein JW779_08610 [Candidatus Thorarchaeota archaeon]|nr:hypothetical protein [Candidatus Thorarchaeota archaeon]